MTNRFALSADIEDHPEYGWGFTVSAHDRQGNNDAFGVERRYGMRSQHQAETAMEKAWQKWLTRLDTPPNRTEKSWPRR